MAHILIVEDNHDYRELLQNFLENAGHTVSVAEDGAEALEAVRNNKFDLILLDIMLPKIDGYGVCEYIRKTSDVPIIMLTALDSEAHQVKGFNLSIDDYVSKSTSIQIILHKVAAVLRRTSLQESEKLIFCDISMDDKTHMTYVYGQELELTLREFEILRELLLRPGEVVARKYLLDKLWNYNYYGDARIVDTHIKNIRKKLGGADCIEAVRGVGYKLKKVD
ncbi:MAG: response regulator transcription factor [Bacillota bacterium]|nr:response regulator transcription factor [Bacillota bacterium]